MQINDQRKRQHDAEQIHRPVQDQRIGKRDRRIGDTLTASQHDGHIIQAVVEAVKQNV